MTTEQRPAERIPLVLLSLAVGLLAVGLLAALILARRDGGFAAGGALVAALPFALAALTGVAKSATP